MSCRDLLELCRGYGDGGQRTGADGVRPEHRPDPADHAADLQFPQVIEQGVGTGIQLPGDALKRFRVQRELPLEVIEQIALSVSS